MVLDGIVERVDVGEKEIRCLRLTKYNPEVKPQNSGDPGKKTEHDLARPTDGHTSIEQGGSSLMRQYHTNLADADCGPYHAVGHVPLTTTIEYQMNQAVIQSGNVGLTINVCSTTSSRPTDILLKQFSGNPRTDRRNVKTIPRVPHPAI